jgi:hypothetical protein
MVFVFLISFLFSRVTQFPDSTRPLTAYFALVKSYFEKFGSKPCAFLDLRHVLHEFVGAVSIEKRSLDSDAGVFICSLFAFRFGFNLLLDTPLESSHSLFSLFVRTIESLVPEYSDVASDVCYIFMGISSCYLFMVICLWLIY